jgi:hypothetical protein
MRKNISCKEEMPGASTPSPNGSRRGSVSAGGGDLSGNSSKKFLNGWTPEQERLMAEWADIAGCYKWLNDRAEKIYTRSNMMITIPVIILSTLTGTANFAVSSFIPEGSEGLKKYVSAGIGGISIFAGILTTLGNFFQYAQKSEAHRVASIAWGKFQRQVTVELAIHPDERIEAMDFLKICRQDLDRLIEQSPPIPDPVVVAFEKEFKGIPNLKVPDICHGIEHTRVYDASKPRLGKITAEAALFLKYRKAALARELVPAMEQKIEAEMQRRVEARLQDILRSSQEVAKEAGTAAAQALVPAAIASANAAAEAAAEEEARSVMTPVETDWRRLLTERKKVLQPVAAGGLQRRKSMLEGLEIVPPARTENVIITVGGGDAPPPPSTPHSEAGAGGGPGEGAPGVGAPSDTASVTSRPVTTEVNFD